MAKTNSYKNLIFTTHGWQRLKKRSISPDALYRTIQSAEKTFEAGENKKKFIRTLNGRTYHVVANYDQKQRAWIVISAWVRGEEDQPSLEWQLISFPFKFIWWLLRKIINIFITH